MAGDENIEIAKRGYAAFAAGDAEGAMAEMHDDVEWVTPGNSAISGTRRGKQELGELWGTFAANGFSSTPQYWFSDADRVVVLTQVSLGDESYDAADVLTFRDGKLARFQSAGDTAALERVFGTG